MDRQPIISAKDVEITFSLRGKKLNAIRKCSLDLYDGETLAIVGESGSGKSVFTKTFVGMLDVNGKITGGSIMYEGRDMTKFTEKDWLGIRGKKIAMVMQDPMTSLNPLKKIGKQIQESIEHHQGLDVYKRQPPEHAGAHPRCFHRQPLAVPLRCRQRVRDRHQPRRGPICGTPERAGSAGCQRPGGYPVC